MVFCEDFFYPSFINASNKLRGFVVISNCLGKGESGANGKESRFSDRVAALRDQPNYQEL